MAEAANVRLVLCPRCENLLTELPDFSFYKCGGCGAILKANRKVIDGDGLTDVPNDTKVQGVMEDGGMVNASEVNAATDSEIVGRKVELIHNEEMVSTRQAENMKTAADSDQSGSRKESVKLLKSAADEQKMHSQGVVRSKNPGKSCDLNLDMPQYVRPPLDSLKPRPFMDQWNVEDAGSGPSSVRARGLPAQGRSDGFLYPDECPSSYARAASYEQGQSTGYQVYDIDDVARVGNTESGRAELLRRLDALRDKISRSCDIEAKSNDRIGAPMRLASPSSPDHYSRYNDPYNLESMTNSRPVAKPPFVCDNMGPPYRGHSSEFSPYMGMYGPRMPEAAYPPGGRVHEIPLCPDNYKNEMVYRSSYHPRSQHMQQPYPEHLPQYYGDPNQEPFVSNRRENRFHQATCSCMHCYGNNQHMPSCVNPRTFHTRKAQNEIRNPTFASNLYPIPHRSQYVGPGGSSLHPLRSRQPQNSNELDFGNDGFSYHNLRKVVVSHGSKRVSHPIAGGAPFITCCNCFELVKLPRKFISSGKKPQEMRCGACSSIIIFEVGKETVASVSTRADQVPTENDEGSIGTVDANIGYWNDGSDFANRNTLSDDFDDSQLKFSATDNNSDSCELKRLDLVSDSSCFSQDEKTLENVLPEKRGSPSEELPSKEAMSSPDAHLSPRECFNHNQDSIVENRLNIGSKSKRTGEKGSLDRTTSLQTSAIEQAVATEIDVPSNEFSNSSVSQGSYNRSKENRPKASKGVESFLTGLMKKSFRDFKKLNESVEVFQSEVFVNGHLVPDRAVKKAEKLAGPIQPGDYWYDKKAGFWGVMGHPCLGIIMPNIEEFNHPLPDDCAAGNTSVFVNGRELHLKDLDLLASRGLPIRKNRSYLIDMTGEVVDEQTGEELEGLGKLAPTVERAKRGFGMRVPRIIAQHQS